MPIRAKWKPDLHPRDRHGRFIDVMGWVRWLTPDGTPQRGQVTDIEDVRGQSVLRVRDEHGEPDHFLLPGSVDTTPAPKGSLRPRPELSIEADTSIGAKSGVRLQLGKDDYKEIIDNHHTRVEDPARVHAAEQRIGALMADGDWAERASRINLDGLYAEDAEEIADTLTRMHDEHPGTFARRFAGIVPDHALSPGGDPQGMSIPMAMTTSFRNSGRVGAVISLDKSLFKAEYDEPLSQDNPEGGGPLRRDVLSRNAVINGTLAGDSVESILAHEFGHVVSLDARTIVNPDAFMATPPEMHVEIALNHLRPDDMGTVSRYGDPKQNGGLPDEEFAESFSAYEMGTLGDPDKPWLNTHSETMTPSQTVRRRHWVEEVLAVVDRPSADSRGGAPAVGTKANVVLPITDLGNLPPEADIIPDDPVSLRDEARRGAIQGGQVVQFHNIYETLVAGATVNPTDMENIPSWDAVKKHVADQLRREATGPIAIRANESDTTDIAVNGYLANQFITGTSNGAYDPLSRSEFEGTTWGDDARSRIVYGYVASPDARSDSPVAGYGDIVFVMKPDTLKRSTVTFGDSLMSQVAPLPLTSLSDANDDEVMGAFSSGTQLHYVAKALVDLSPPEEGLYNISEEEALSGDLPLTKTVMRERIKETVLTKLGRYNDVDWQPDYTEAQIQALPNADTWPDDEDDDIGWGDEPQPGTGAIIPLSWVDHIEVPSDVDLRRSGSSISGDDLRLGVQEDFPDIPVVIGLGGLNRVQPYMQTDEVGARAAIIPDVDEHPAVLEPYTINLAPEDARRVVTEDKNNQFAKEYTLAKDFERKRRAKAHLHLGPTAEGWGDLRLPEPTPEDEPTDMPSMVETKEIIADRFKEHAAGPVVIRVPRDYAESIVEHGGIGNQFVTGTSRGAYAPDARSGFESRVWGEDERGRIVYGYIFDPEHPRQAGNYGDVIFVLKPEVDGRTTVTSGDSLGAVVAPIPLSEVDAATPDEVIAAFSEGAGVSQVTQAANNPNSSAFLLSGTYMEAQVQGEPISGRDVGAKVPLEWVDHIEFDTDYGDDAHQRAEWQSDFDALAAQFPNIPVMWHDGRKIQPYQQDEVGSKAAIQSVDPILVLHPTRLDPHVPREAEAHDLFSDLDLKMDAFPTETQDEINRVAFGTGKGTVGLGSREQIKARYSDLLAAAKTRDHVIDVDAAMQEGQRVISREGLEPGEFFDQVADWYPFVHVWAQDTVNQYGKGKVNLDQFAGMTAALSQRSKFRTDKLSIGNPRQATEVLKAIVDDPPLGLTDKQLATLHKALRKQQHPIGNRLTPLVDPDFDVESITADTKFSEIDDPVVAAIAFNAYSVHNKLKAGGLYTATSQAIRIARGEDPDDVLIGSKIRSFFNNIVDPDGASDTTIDSLMLDAAYAGTANQDVSDPSLRRYLSGAQMSTATGGVKFERRLPGAEDEKRRVSGPTKKNPNARQNTFLLDVGVRPILADVIRELAEEWGMTPNGVQAVIWSEYQQENPPTKKSATKRAGGGRKHRTPKAEIETAGPVSAFPLEDVALAPVVTP